LFQRIEARRRLWMIQAHHHLPQYLLHPERSL
jgi:hypothetical protein